MVLDKGEIAEFASPQELMSDPNSIFYSMASSAGLASDDNGKDVNSDKTSITRAERSPSVKSLTGSDPSVASGEFIDS